MKRLTIAGILISLSILLSGCFAIEKYYQWKYAREKEEIIKIVESEEADEMFKDILLHLEPDALTQSSKIQSYTIDYDSLRYVPTGGIKVAIFINGDPELHISSIFHVMKDGSLELSNSKYSFNARRFINE